MAVRQVTVHDGDMTWMVTLLDDDPANRAWILRAVGRRSRGRAAYRGYCRRR